MPLDLQCCGGVRGDGIGQRDARDRLIESEGAEASRACRCAASASASAAASANRGREIDGVVVHHQARDDHSVGIFRWQ